MERYARELEKSNSKTMLPIVEETPGGESENHEEDQSPDSGQMKLF